MSQRNAILLVIFSFFFIAFSSHSSETAKFNNNFYEKSIPDNDLWKQDCLNCKSRSTGIDEQIFSKIIDIAYDLYLPLADADKEMLVINKNWEDSTVNASCSRMWGTVEIKMYGGLARREEITVEGFTLVLCHELSHAYGGLPYIMAYNKMSAEGQADYMATFECAHKVFKELGAPGLGMDPTQYMVNICNGDILCLSSLVGGQSLGNLLATIKKVEMPNYETPDPTVVTKTILTYPDTIQCRLDTYHNGTLGKDRPLCWYKP